MNQFGSLGDWVSTNFGLALTIGGIIATVAAIEGSLGVGRNVERLVDLSDEVAASGGPPSPEQQSQIQRLGAKKRSSARSISFCCFWRWQQWRRRVIGKAAAMPNSA